MAADTQQFGVDPTGQPQQMPPDQGQQVDPNSPPADPMLGGPDAEDQAEFQTRERVELQLLLAIEACAKATMVGEGASNPQFVQGFGQACQAMSLAYQSLATIEQKENAPPPSPPQFGGGVGGGVPLPTQSGQ